MRRPVTGVLLACFSMWSVQSKAATFYWDGGDATTVGNNINGTGLGGTGTWDTLTPLNNWWDGTASDVAWSNSLSDTAIFTGAPGTVTLGNPITAGSLIFNSSGYTINGAGNALTIGGPIAVNGMGSRALMNVQLSGTTGFTKTGNGTLVLSDNTSNFSGDTSIKAGSVFITSESALGVSTNTISITGVAQTGSPGFTGGSLVLVGSGNTMNREISISGRGPGAVNASGGFVSMGSNTLAGGLVLGSAVSEGRALATHGITTVTGGLYLGAGNAEVLLGNGNWIVSGQVTGNDVSTDRFIKSGNVIGTTLWLQNPDNSYLQPTRIDSGTVRVSTNTALGRSIVTQAVDLNNGLLEIRTDTPGVGNADFSTRKVFNRDNTNTGIFVGGALTGSAINQTVVMGETRSTGTNTNFRITGRDGFNLTLTGAGNLASGIMGAGGSNNALIENNSNGLLTLATSSLWNQTDGSARTLTMQGSGDMLVTGNITASGSTHNFSKAGSGTLTIQGTNSTFTGSATITAGTLSIGTFGAVNASAGRIIFGGGTLNYTGGAETLATKGLLMNATNNIIANNGTGGIILQQNFGNNGTGAKNVVLGGSNAGVNDLQGHVINTTAGAGVTKFDTGVWQISSTDNTSTAAIGTVNAAFPITAIGTTATNIVSTTSTTSLVVGQPVSGTGVPFGTVISQIISATQFATSQNLASTGTSIVLGTVVGSTSAINVASNAGNVLTVGGATTSTANLVVGQPITGPGMVAGAGWYISAINGATTFTVANTTGVAALGTNAAAGALTPSISASFAGPLTISGGTLVLNQTGSSAETINNSSSVIFAADPIRGNGFAGGTLNYKAFNAGSSETAGILSITAGAGTVQITPSGGTNSLVFGSITAPSLGTSLDFSVPAGNGVTLTAAPAVGLLNAHAYYNGADFAYNPATTNSTLRAPVYGTDAGFTAVNTLTAATNVAINTNASSGTLAVTSLKISGSSTLNLTGTLTVGGSTGGGIILTGGSGGLGQGTGGAVTTATAGDLAIRVNEANQTFTLAVPITATTTGGLTKNGPGKLVLSAANAQTGTTTINDGTIQLAGSGALSGSGRPLTMRQGTTLDLNNISTGTSVGAFNGTGLITNTATTAAAGPVVFTIGNGVTAATNAAFTGVIENFATGAAASNVMAVTVTGAPTTGLVYNQALSGVNTYSGVTTISNTGAGSVVLQANSLADGGLPSSIGKSSNAAANLVFNGGTLQYIGSTGQIFQTTQTPSVSTDRLFTLAGNATIQSSGTYGSNTITAAGGANNATLIFSNTADIVYSGTATARSLTLGGTSTGDNEMRIHLVDNGAGALSLIKADAGLWILNPTSSSTYTGSTTITGGALQVSPVGAAIQGLPAASHLIFNGGVLQTSGSFTRSLTTTPGTNTVQFTGNGGFAASDARLTVNLSNGATLTLGSAPTAGSTLILNSSTSLADVELTNPINLGTAAKTIQVDDNPNTGLDFATVSNVISGGAGGTLTKSGGAPLILGNANTYVGNTTVTAGNLIVTSIGNASGTTSSSLGASGGTLVYNPGDSDLNALLYVGAGETASRPITFTSSSSQTANRVYRLDSSGSGALTLEGAFTNTIAQSATGRVVTLELRGNNTDLNMMNMVLSNSTGTNNPLLAVSKTDGGVWVLNPASQNTFTGTITASAGLLGLTTNGIGSASGILLNNGGIFAYGGPLSTSTPVSGNNSTGVFAGKNAITLNAAVTKTAGNNTWTISNSMEDGALLTINGSFINAEAGTTAATQTINIRGFGSTLWNGAITENAAAGGKIAWNIALDPNASFTTSGAANTYSGGTTLTDGILIIAKSGASLGALGTGTFAFNGGTLRTTLPGGLVGTNAISNGIALNNSPPKVDGSLSIEFSGAVTMAASRNLQNEMTGGAQLILSGTVTNTTASTLTIYGSGNTLVSGNVTTGTGAQGLAFSGTGALSLTGTNLATGALTVNRSTITLSGTTGGTWNAGTFALNPTGTLTLDNSGGNNAAGRLNDAGAIAANGGTLNLISAAGGTSETAGALTLNVVQSYITMSGAGNNTLTFASVALPNTGSALDLSSITGLGSTNKVIFTAAPTLTNGITTRFLLGNDFATHGATGIVPYSAYNNTNNINAALAADTLNLTASSSLTSNRTINALKINGTGLVVGGAPFNRLTLGAAAILNTGGNNTLSTPEVAFAGVAGVVQVAAGTTLTVDSALTGTGGFAKFLPGTLKVNTPGFISSTLNFLDGKTILNGGLNTFFPAQNTNLNVGATLDLNDTAQYLGTLSGNGSLPLTAGDVVNGGMGTGTLVTNGGGTFGGRIMGNNRLGRIGGGTLLLESAQSYTGITLLLGGTTTLENDATLLNTSAIELNGGTLSLSNNSGLQTQMNNRVGDAIGITMRTGAITLTGRITSAASETLGALSVLQGANSITSNTGGGTVASADLTFASFSRTAGSGATVNFSGTTLGQQGNSSHIYFTAPLTTVGGGVLGAWAIANSADYAAYNSGNGVGVVGQGGFTGYDGTFASGNITELQANANVVTQLPGSTTTAMLKFSGGFTNDLTFTGANDVLNLQLGGILRSNNNSATSIGTVAARGVITSGVPELVVYNNANTTGATVMTINSVIQGAGTTLVKSGAGVLALTAQNTYGNGTIVSQGTLELRGTNAGDVVIPAGNVTLTNANITMFNNAGQIATGNPVFLNGGAQLTLVGNNSLDSLTFDNNGGTATPTVTSGGILTLTNSTPITVTSSNAATVATIAGSLNLGASGTRTINTPDIQMGGVTVSRITPALNISAAILSPGVSLIKSGSGILQLGGASTFSGFTFSNGGVLLSGSSTPTTGGNGIATGPLGTGSVTAASGTTFLVDGSRTLANDISFAGTPTFDSTANTAWTLTLNGALTGTAFGGPVLNVQITNPNLTVALLGRIPNIGSITSINKTGLGSLQFNSTGYTGSFNVSQLGAPGSLTIFNDGDGTGRVQTVSLGAINFDAGIVPALTIGRAGGTLPFTQAQNKMLAPSSFSSFAAGLTLTNNNGYGLVLADAATLTGTPTLSVSAASASNVVQGLYLNGVLGGTGFIKAGAGTLVLGNTGNTFTGNINIGQGVISVDADSELGTATNVIQLNPTTGTSTLRATDSFTLAHPLQFANTANTRAIEVVAGRILTLNTAFDLGAANANAAASLTKGDNGTLLLTVGNPNYTGALTLSGGAIKTGITNALGSGTLNISNPGAALQLTGTTIANAITITIGSDNFTNTGLFSGGAVEALSGTNVISTAITVTGAPGADNTSRNFGFGADSGATLTLPGVNFSHATGGTNRNMIITLNSEGTINLGGILDNTNASPGSSFVFKVGAGTTNLTAAGGIPDSEVRVYKGTLAINGAGTLGTGTTTALVYADGTLTLDNSATNTAARLSNRVVNLSGGLLNVIPNTAGSTQVSTGALQINSGGSTINLGAGGTSTVTFASLSQGAGATANVTGTFGSATNKLTFTTAPTLTPATTGLLARVTVNGNEFASYNATNGIVAFTGYAAGSNILSAGATQTFKATVSTANSLTGNQTLNALTLTSGPAVDNIPTVGGLSGLNPTTLTLTSGGILANGTGSGTNSVLSVPVVAFNAVEAILHVAAGQTLDVTSGFSGSAGLTKSLGGVLNFNAQQFVTGNTTVNAGTLNLNSGVTNTLMFNQGLVLNAGTVDLKNSTQFVAGLSSAGAGAGTNVGGGVVTNTGAQATFVVNSNTNFGGVIQGSIFLNKTGTGALNLQAPQTYTGETYLTGGSITLADNGSLPATSQPITLNYSSLILTNTSLYDNADRVSNTAPITLRGGTITFNGRQATASSETLGDVSLVEGMNTIASVAGSAGLNSADLNIGALSRPAGSTATVRFDGRSNSLGLLGSNAHITFTSINGVSTATVGGGLVNNIIAPWAIVDREFATYAPGLGIGQLGTTGFAAYSALGLTNPVAATDNIRISSSTTLAADTAINTLNIATGGTAITLDLNGKTLRVQGGGLLIAQSNDNITTSINNGTLTSGTVGSPSDFYLIHGNYGGAGRAAAIGAVIANNGTGGTVRLIKSGGSNDGVTTLNAINTYTGGTVVNTGNLTVGATGALGTGGITVNAGTLSQTAGGSIGTQALMMNGNSTVTLANQANTITTLSFNNNGGAAPTLSPTGTLKIQNGGAINVTTVNAGNVAVISGGTLDLDGNNSFGIAVGKTLVNSVDVAPWQAGLNITSVIQNGGISKTGGGILQLSGQNTFAGGVSVATGGGIIIGASSTPNGIGDTVTSGPLGTGAATFAANTTVLSSGAFTVSNNVTFLGDTVFNGLNNLTFNGVTTLPSVWNATVTAPQMTVTIADATPSQAVDQINKSGLGVLTVGNYAGTINVTGGLVFLADGNDLGTPENVSLGGALNITGDTLLTINRSGGGPNARNKTLQKSSLTISGSILAVANLSGYGLEITGPTTLNGAAHFSVANASASNVVQGITLSGVVDDGVLNVGLVKSGLGSLALTNAGNTFGGAGQTIDILNGILSVPNDGALGNSANSVTLDVDGTTGVGFRATGTFSSARTFILNQPNNAFEVTQGSMLTLTSPFTLSAVGNTLTKNDNGVIELAAANSTWTGAITINAGAIRLSNSAAAGTGAISIAPASTAPGAALQLANGVTIANTITLQGTGNQLLGGINFGGNLQSVSGVNTVSTSLLAPNDAAIGADVGSTLNLTGGITENSANHQIYFTGAGDINLSGSLAISGAATGFFALQKFGSGNLNITSAQPVVLSNSPGLVVNAGVVTLKGAGTLTGPTSTGGSTFAVATVNPGGTLTLDDSTTAVANRLGGRPLTLVGGSFNYIGNTAVNSTETLGVPAFNRGYSVVTVTAQTGFQADLTFAGSANNPGTAQNGSTAPSGASVLFRGSNLGTAAGAGNATIKDTGSTGFTFVGQTGGAGTAAKGLLPWALIDTTVNGNGISFATADTATSILRPLAGTEYAASNTFVANNNINLTAGATATGTTNLNINSLTMAGNSSVTIGSLLQLTSSSGGILVKSGSTSSINGGVINQISTSAPLNVWTLGDLTITSTLAGGNGTTSANIGFVKAGAGTLTLSTPTSTISGLTAMGNNSYTGQLVINGGIVKLNGGTNTIAYNNFLEIGAGGTLDLNGKSQSILTLFSDGSINGITGVTAAGTVTSSTGTGNLVINQDNAARSFAGIITGNVNVTRSGQNTFTLYNDSNYSGTTVINGGTTTLRDNAALSGTSSLELNYATLNLDNATSTMDSSNRLKDSASITLRGGTLSLLGRAQTASTETVGGVTLAQANSFISSTVGGTGINSSDLTVTSLNRAAGGGTVNFTAATGGQIGSSARILIPTINGASTSSPGGGLTRDIIGGWAIINTSDFATYVPGLGVAALGATGAAQYSTKILSAGGLSDDNIRVNYTAASTISADTTINSVKFDNVVIGGVTVAAGKTLTLASGGFLNFTSTPWNFGTAVNQGNLTSSGPELFIYTQGNGTPTINTVITGAGMSLVKSGANTLNLASTSTYDGGTFVNQGTVTIATTGNIPLAANPANGLVVSSATVTLNAAGSINAGNIVTVNGNGTVNLYGNNTLVGLVFNNNGGTANPTLNTFSTLNQAGSTGVLTIGTSGIVATSSNVGTTSNLFGRVDFGTSANTVNVDTINVNGTNDVAPLQAGFALQGVVGSSGGFTKTGAGVLGLNAQMIFTGPLTVSTGGVRIGAANGGSRFANLNLASGTRLDLAGSTSTFGSLSGSGIVFNSGGATTLTVGYDNTSTTFSGTLVRFNDATLNAVGVTKIGTGRLDMTGVQTVASGSTGAFSVNNGVLAFSGSGALFTGTSTPSFSSTLNVNAGGTLLLDNSVSNVNQRLGLTTAGTLNLQGGNLVVKGNDTVTTAETITTFNIVNGGGFVTLQPSTGGATALNITTLNSGNSTGSAVFRGLSITPGNGNLTITTPNLLGSQGTGANGTTTMAVRADSLGDFSATGNGTGFLVKDSVANLYRPLNSGTELNVTPATWASTQNAGILGSSQSIAANTTANTFTFSGTASLNNALDPTTFGSYGPSGLLTQIVLGATALLALDGATATINVPALTSNSSTTMYFHTVGSSSITLNGYLGAGATTIATNGFVKTGDGTLTLAKQAFTAGGNYTVNGGTLNLASGVDNTLPVVPGVTTPALTNLNINGVGALVDLKGNSQAVNTLTAINPQPGMGGIVTNSGSSVVTLTSTGGGTFSGAITGNIAFTRAGNSTTLLTNASTYTGSTIVRGGTLQLRDSGMLSSTAGLTLNYGTLNWDNSGLSSLTTLNPVRLNPANAVTLQGGQFTINGGGSIDTTAVVNSLTVTGGANGVSLLPYVNEGSTVKLTVGNLVRNTANHSTVNFNGFSQNNSSSGANTMGGIGLSTNSNIILTQINGAAFSAANLTNKIIGGWAVADGSTFATYVDGVGVIAMGNTFGSIVAPGFDGTDLTATTTAAQNVNDSTSGRAVSGSRAVNSWRFAGNATDDITLATATPISFGTGIITNSNTTVNITGADSTSTVAGTGSDLYIYVNQSTLNLKAKITGGASLVKSGGGTLGLFTPTAAASNDYTGGTFVHQGTLTLNAGAGFVLIPGDLTLNNATVTMATNGGQIASTSNVTINGGGTLNLVGSNTLNSLTFDNQGGTGNPTVATATSLTLSAANAITANNDSLATTPVISGTALVLASTTPVINVTGMSPDGLQISAPITSAGGVITKTGAGALVLSGASTFNTGFNLSAGTLIMGVASTGTITNGPVGIGTLTLSSAGNSTTILGATSLTVGNSVVLGGDFTFGGVTSTNNLNLSGAINLGAVGRTITVSSPAVTGTLSGQLTSTNATGATLTKAGPGTLVLSSSATTAASFGTGSIAITEGILKNGVDNTIPNTTPLSISAGAGYDINAFNQNLQFFSGSGFITNSGAAKTLAIGTSATDVTSNNNNTFAGALVSATANNLTVVKAGLGTLTLTNGGTSQYTGLTSATGAALTIVAGKVLGTADNAFPLGTVTVANATTGAANLTATLDVGTTNQTIGSLVASPNTSGSLAVINVGPAKTLTINGSVTLGSNTSAADVSKINFTGGGNVVVNNSGGTFQVGGATGSTNIDTTTVDMTGLANFTANLGSTGTFRVGSNSGNGGSTTIGQTTLSLAATSNTITAGTISVGEPASEQVAQTLRLGAGTNVLNGNTINIGTNTGRGAGVLNFASSTGTLVVRAADGTSRAALNQINGAAGTGSALTSNIDLTGHNADLYLSTFTTAARSAMNSSGDATSTFSFDTGTLDVTTINASNRSGTNTAGLMTSTFNFGGGAVTIGSLNLAINSAASGTATGGSTATVNVTGGTVNIGAISMANVSGNALNKATSLLNFTGGTVTLGGDITRTTTTGTQSTTLTLNGSVLDMGSHNIGSAAALIQALNFQSGTLKNVNEINGGAALNKTTAGTLVLTGTNAYTGVTNVQAGILDVQSTTGLGGTAAGTTVTAAATLQINNVAVGNEAVTLNGVGAGGMGALNGLGTASLSGTVALASSSSIGASTVTDTLTLSGKVTASSVQTLTKVGLGTVVLAADNSTTLAGPVTVTAGKLSVSNSSNLGTAAASNSVTLNGGTLQSTGTFDLGSTRTLTVGASGGAVGVTGSNILTVSGAITGTGILTKNDTGTLVINSDSPSGVTMNVADGILSVASGKTISGATNVNGGILSGTGTVAGDTNVSGGLINAGGVGTAGTLTFGGALGLNTSGTSIVFDISGRTYFTSDFVNEDAANLNNGLNGASNDFIQLTGASAPTFDANTVIRLNSFNGYIPQVGDVLNLFDWAALAGPITGFAPTAANFDYSSLGSSMSIDFSRFTTTGAIAITPEPSRMLLLLVGLLGLGMRRRRKGSL